MSSTSPAPTTAEFGVIGLGVMGANLALNIVDHGFTVAVWNQTRAKVHQLLARHRDNVRLHGADTLDEFTRMLALPRRVVMLVKAGAPVDEMLERLTPHLVPGDIVVDGGNSFFRDTQRRDAAMRSRGLSFVGMGVSGGEEGARTGPSLMPGGALDAYERLRPMLEAIAAKTESGPSVTYVGPDGAGHYVKMVHNGIEYGIMQAIAEAYDLLRRGLDRPAAEVAGIFADWNRGPLESYLIDVAAQVLAARDPETGNPLVEMILDQAGQKGTGQWTVRSALDLGLPVPTIAAAVDARVLSSMKSERMNASSLLRSATSGRVSEPVRELIPAVHDALRATMVCCYAQGLSLLRAASDAYGWHVKLREIARIWKGGCIIRARLLDTLMRAFERAPALPNLLLDPDVREWLAEAESGWRRTILAGTAAGIPVPAMAASVAYFDSYRTARLPQNLTQAQRDYFGAHTYQRVDRAEAGFVHTDWLSLREGERTAKGTR